MKRALYIISVLIFLLSACGSKENVKPTDTPVVQSNTQPYSIDDIKLGMSMEEVRNILGLPDNDIGSGTVIDQYVFSDDTIATIGYQMDSDCVFRVSYIDIDSPYSEVGYHNEAFNASNDTAIDSTC